MNVPFHLRRGSRTEAASAALFAGPDPARRLLALCATLRLDPDGRVFGVSGGLLLILREPTVNPLPGALRLRRLAPNLLLPVDAELVPSLLDDEAHGMGRDRGLIFLPDGRVLAFDPGGPLPSSSLLNAPSLPQRDWKPLPDRPELADRIGSILVDFPDESPEATLDDGTVGVDAGDPDGADPGASGISRAWKQVKSFVTGKSGKDQAKPGPHPPPDRGAIRRQEAALRELVSQFREGNTERALRRSLPLADPGESRGAGSYGGSQLPDRPLEYRLQDLLGGGKGGPAGQWLGGDDLLAALMREYRKAAEEATRRGDHRRAAAIYGKLLRDDRAAAQALLQGGLYHDAGVLLLARLDDRRGAARAFASAGETDRAIELYREVGDHEAAGDLLRSLGEEDDAVAEYRLAADRLAASSSGYLAAGNLLLGKAGRPDLALTYYRFGWKQRPAPNAVACALQAARIHAEEGAIPEIRSLVDQADAHFSTFSGPVEAGQFYNGVASLTELAGLAPARDELRDRALIGLATQIRLQARPGEKAHSLVPALLGSGTLWAPAVFSDAAHAVAVATRPGPSELPSSAGKSAEFRLCTGTVSAVTGASATGDLFVGTAGGDVWAFHPSTSATVSVASHDLPVAALATDARGEFLVVLRSHESGRGVISSYRRESDGRYRFLTFTHLEAATSPWLTQVQQGAGHSIVGVWDGESFHILIVATFSPLGIFPLPDIDDPPPAGVLIGRQGNDEFSILTHLGREWHRLYPCEGSLVSTGIRWRPGIQDDALRSVPLSVLEVPGGLVEIAGLNARGVLHWSRMPHAELISLKAPGASEGGFLAAAIVREGLVAAVSRYRVDWLRCGATSFSPWRTTPQSIPTALAAFSSRVTNEVLVVCRNGNLVRLPIPD